MSYVPPGAVRFSGNTILKCASLACADNGKFSLFAYYHALRSQNQNTLFAVGRPGSYLSSAAVQYGNAPYLNPQVDFSHRIYAQSSGGNIDLVWHPLLMTADASTGEFKIYLDGVEVTDDSTIAGIPFVPLFNGKSFWVGGDGFSGNYIIGDLGIFWAYPGLSLLSGGDIPLLTQRLFYDADNLPMDPAGFPGGTPPIFLNGPASTFATNLGNGGAFSVDGDPLTDSPTLPGGGSIIKTMVVSSGSTVELPPNFAPENSLIHAIGGGMPGVGGSEGVKWLAEHGTGADPFWPSPAAGSTSGDGGYYTCQYNWPGLLPGQVLDISVAVAAPGLTQVAYREDPVGYNFSTPSWIKDTTAAYILFSPGGDNFDDSSVGEFYSDGFGSAGNNVFAGSAAGSAAGSPFSVYWGSPANAGGGSGVSDETQVQYNGMQSFGGAGATTQVNPNQQGNAPRGTRTAAGAGNDNGNPGGGGNGGTLTVGNGSSLLLPTPTPPFSPPITSTSYITYADSIPTLGTNDFTIEFFHQWSLVGEPQGTHIGKWDYGTNQKGWRVTANQFGSGLGFTCSSNGSAEDQFGFFPKTNPGITYYDSVLYPDAVSASVGIPDAYAINHYAVCRESNALRFFLNGVPLFINDGGPVLSYTHPITTNIFGSTSPLTVGGTLKSGVLGNNSDDPGNALGPVPGWYGNIRVTAGLARYTCPATAPYGSPLGQQFVPPTAPMAGGDFLTNWPGTKGATSSTPGGMVFHGDAQIDTDVYCYTDSPGVGGDGEDGFDGDLWVDSLTAVVAGPGGGPGGGAGSFGRFKANVGGKGGNGGKYGAGGGQGGYVNMAEFMLLGSSSYTSSVGGEGASGVLIIQYEPAFTPPIEDSVNESASAADAENATVDGNVTLAESATPTDTTDATKTRTPAFWMSIGDVRDSIYPN